MNQCISVIRLFINRPPFFSRIGSFLESFCCCFGYGVPQNHYELMQKREMQHRRLIAKEERHRLAQFQKLQEKQRQLQIQQRQQQLEAKNASSGTTTAGKASTNEAVV